MGDSLFRFKKFDIEQDRCAMKVGSDAIALGAWTIETFLSQSGRPSVAKVLDIGSGSGVLSLMLAQGLSGSQILAVEKEPEAAAQAGRNFARSRYTAQIQLIVTAIQKLRGFDAAFDLIVSNPPYFGEALLPADRKRQEARHQGGLKPGELIKAAIQMLSPGGFFCVILPADSARSFVIRSMSAGLWLLRETALHDTVEAVPKRILLAFSPEEGPFVRDELIMKDASGRRASRFAALTEDFYL